MDAKDIRAMMAKQRDQKFRKYSEKQILSWNVRYGAKVTEEQRKNLIEAARKRDNTNQINAMKDPKTKEKIREGMKNSTTFKLSRIEAGKKRRGIPNLTNRKPFIALGIEYASKTIAQDALGISAGSLRERLQYRPWEYYLKETGPIYYPIQTPDGIFQTVDEAAKHFNTTKSGIGVRISRHPDNYYYVKFGPKTYKEAIEFHLNKKVDNSV